MKKIWPGLLAVILAIGFSSFSVIKEKYKLDTTYYFGNTGTETSPNWVLIGTDEPDPMLVCDTDPDNDCLGTSNSENGTVTPISKGDYNP